MVVLQVSASQCETVRRYIEQQEQRHRTRIFQQEYLELLRRHNIEFDEAISDFHRPVEAESCY
jgi:hypothetical protein